MKELAQLQKEKNDWRCNSWLEAATGRSTVLAAPPGKVLACLQCMALNACAVSSVSGPASTQF